MKGQGKARAETIIHLRAFALAVCPAWITLSSFIPIVFMSTEGLDVLPCLQAINLVSPSSMYAGRGPDASGLETKDFVTHSSIWGPSINVLLCCSLECLFSQRDMKRAGWHQPLQWVVYRRGTESLGNWHEWKWAVSAAVFPSIGGFIFILLESKCFYD